MRPDGATEVVVQVGQRNKLFVSAIRDGGVGVYPAVRQGAGEDDTSFTVGRLRLGADHCADAGEARNVLTAAALKTFMVGPSFLPGCEALPAEYVQALGRVAVPAGLVAAAVDHAQHGLDA